MNRKGMQFGRNLLPSPSFICFINWSFASDLFLWGKSMLLKKLKSILKNTRWHALSSLSCSKTWVSAKCLPLLEPSYLQSQKQPGHFQQPIKSSVLGQQEKQTLQRAVAKTETHPTCPENKPNTPSQNALLIKYRKCQQDHKDVSSKVDEQPVLCFDYGLWLPSEQRTAQEHKAVLHGHPCQNNGPCMATVKTSTSFTSPPLIAMSK